MQKFKILTIAVLPFIFENLYATSSDIEKVSAEETKPLDEYSETNRFDDQVLVETQEQAKKSQAVKEQVEQTQKEMEAFEKKIEERKDKEAVEMKRFQDKTAKAAPIIPEIRVEELSPEIVLGCFNPELISKLYGAQQISGSNNAVQVLVNVDNANGSQVVLEALANSNEDTVGMLCLLKEGSLEPIRGMAAKAETNADTRNAAKKLLLAKEMLTERELLEWGFTEEEVAQILQKIDMPILLPIIVDLSAGKMIVKFENKYLSDYLKQIELQNVKLNMEGQISKAKEKSASKNAAIRADLENLEKVNLQAQELQEQVENLRRELDSNSAVAREIELKARLVEAEADFAKKMEEGQDPKVLEEVKKKLEEAEKNLASKKSTLSSTPSTITQGSGRRVTTAPNPAYQTVQNEVNSAENEVKSAKQALEDLEKASLSSQAVIDEERTKVEKLRQELAEASQLVASAKKPLEEKEAELQKVRGEIKAIEEKPQIDKYIKYSAPELEEKVKQIKQQSLQKARELYGFSKKGSVEVAAAPAA